MQVQLLGPLSCVLCSRVTLTGSGVLHVPAAFPALQKIYLKCGSWLSRRIESALSQTDPSLFYSFSAVCIILKQREEALNELFLQWNHTQFLGSTVWLWWRTDYALLVRLEWEERKKHL